MAKKKVLAVEDDVMLLEMIKLQLEEKYDVVTAENGKEGLFKALAEKPDLILADIMMPELDGNQMIRMIRAESSLKDTPIIVLSALGREQDIKISMEIGANDYIVKPFFANDLIKMIEKYLP